MADIAIEIGLVCKCGYCSNDTIKVAVHFSSCKEINKLPLCLRNLATALLKNEVEKKK